MLTETVMLIGSLFRLACKLARATERHRGVAKWSRAAGGAIG
jgi:hypothetical protein